MKVVLSMSKNKPDEDDNKKTSAKSEEHEAIDRYFDLNEDPYANLQFLQPLRAPEDTLGKDDKGNCKKPENSKIIRAFYRYRAIKTHIANNLGCSRPTLNKWIEEDEDLQLAFDDAEEAAIDHSESKLMELIDGVIVQDYDMTGKPVVYKTKPDVKALAIHLGSRAKKRGYGKEDGKKKDDGKSFEDNLQEMNDRSSELDINEDAGEEI